METKDKHGWFPLPCGYEVHFEHGVPVSVSDEARPKAVPEDQLQQEIAQLGSFRVTVGAWKREGGDPDSTASLTVAKEDFGLVLQVLARLSGGLFVSRFGKAVSADDPDWDDESYAVDFNAALKYCGLGWKDVDKNAFGEQYRTTLENEAKRLSSHSEDVRTFE